VKLATATLEECFERFVRLPYAASAHKMEALDAYSVTAETEALGIFRERLAGRFTRTLPERSVRTSPWLARIQETSLAGKAWSRTRVCGWPPTEYQRFQFAYGYPPSIEAGEVIRVADKTEHPELAELDEFWLFDAEGPEPYAALLDYDDSGAWLGCRVTDDPDVISRCQDQVQLAAHFAVPLDVFLSRHGD